MAKRDQNDNTGRTVAIVGGGALLAWLLLRGKGWAFGSGDGEGGGNAAGGASVPASSPAPAVPVVPCRLHIGQAGIRLDGAPADLPSTIAKCRASGSADVTAAGDAITQVVADIVHALQDAGIAVRAAPDVWSTANGTPRKP